MRTPIPSALVALLLSLGIAALAGCAGSTPGQAPIVDRKGSRAPPVAAPASSSAPLEPGFHQVQRGDTLYSIARQYAQDPKNIIIWNQLENPNSIAPGQRVRVAPPTAGGAAANAAAVAEVRPVTPMIAVESRPLGGEPGAPAGSPPASSPPAGPVPPAVPSAAPAGAIKQEPRGGKQPYSEQAWAKARAGDDKPAGGVAQPTGAGEPRPAAKPEDAKPAAADAKPDAKPDGKPDGKPDAKPEMKPEARPANGALDWSWPTGGKVVAGFNDSTSKGIDINGKLGEPVLAAAPGKVLYAGQDLRGYGKLVVVKHSNQYLSVYAHNSEILVKEGQSVSKGQKIAELGKSDAQEPKLHFEIRKQGKPVDPLQYLPAR
jgi:lipoprotein NlpD